MCLPSSLIHASKVIRKWHQITSQEPACCAIERRNPNSWSEKCRQKRAVVVAASRPASVSVSVNRPAAGLPEAGQTHSRGRGIRWLNARSRHRRLRRLVYYFDRSKYLSVRPHTYGQAFSLSRDDRAAARDGKWRRFVPLLTNVCAPQVLAALRFLVLLLAYIVLRMKHWLLVALMTTLSGSLVICKTFLYDWQAQLAVNSGVLAGVLLLVTSFVLPWGQAWFLDFRVVPSENRASQLLARIVNDAFPPVPSAAARLRSEDGGTSFYSPDSGGWHHSPVPRMRVYFCAFGGAMSARLKEEIADSHKRSSCGPCWEVADGAG